MGRKRVMNMDLSGNESRASTCSEDDDTLLLLAGSNSSMADVYNIDMHHVLRTQPSVATNSAAPATTTMPSSKAPGVESVGAYEAKIEIPDELKHILVGDWFSVNHSRQRLKIPADCTVHDITKEYLAYKNLSDTNDVKYKVAVDGIIEYFDVLLASQLLYRSERSQYADIAKKHPNTPPSALYGALHLLRLFVRLNDLLSLSTLEQQSMQPLLRNMNDFLKFLDNNRDLFFFEPEAFIQHRSTSNAQ